MKRIVAFTLTILFLGLLAPPTDAQVLQWTQRNPMPTARTALGAVGADNGRIYAIGGVDSNGIVSTVEEYDPLSDVWVTKAGMRTARASFGLVTLNGKIYAFGGQGSTSFALSSVEKYDPVADTWTTLTDMPIALSATRATISNGRIYVIGGRLMSSAFASTVQEYDPVTDSWAVKSPMPTARTEIALATGSNGKIYAIGGFNGAILATVEEYNPQTDTWTIRSNMPTERVDLGAASVRERIYAIGGFNRVNNGQALATVEEYDFAEDSWSSETSILVPRTNLAVTMGQNLKMYALGGDFVPSPGLANTIEEGTFINQVTSVGPAEILIGVKNKRDVGLHLDLLAEVYRDNMLLSSAQINGASGGGQGFAKALLNTMPFTPFSPTAFPPESTLRLKLYARNACSGPTLSSGTVRLWFNSNEANSHFVASIGTDISFYLLTEFALAVAPGSGPISTIDLNLGAPCSAFQSFGTWNVTPQL